MSEIALPAATPGPWSTLRELVAVLPDDWVLIGGLMVQLHAFEHAVTDVRATADVDLLGQARPPGALEAMDVALRDAGFDPEPPDLDGYAHRYRRDDVVVDVLAPDGLEPAPTLDGSLKAVGVPGGSQALARAETVTVLIGADTFRVRRPNLLGSVLIKARALLVHDDPDTQREDLIRLLSLVEDPRALAADISRAERRWLRRAEAPLRLDEPANLPASDRRRARLALRLLLGEMRAPS